MTRGDPDSVGLFQQRGNWGSREHRLDPTWAANAFLNEMMREFPDDAWEHGQIGVVCQHVQQSDQADRYQPEAGNVEVIVDALGRPRVVSVCGCCPTGRVTCTTLSAATGQPIRSVHSAGSLGFQPEAMATLNFNTLLVTSTSGQLFRVDIITNRHHIEFNRPKLMVAGGWTHDRLTFDGKFLYGIGGEQGMLRRYRVTAAKPSRRHHRQHPRRRPRLCPRDAQRRRTRLDHRHQPHRRAALPQDRRRPARPWSRQVLRDKEWNNVDQLFSPGGGYYCARNDQSRWGYRDADATDGSGADLTGHRDRWKPTAGPRPCYRPDDCPCGPCSRAARRPRRGGVSYP
jgi:hypothetical protein